MITTDIILKGIIGKYSLKLWNGYNWLRIRLIADLINAVMKLQVP
jgi:hypothetical protein